MNQDRRNKSDCWKSKVKMMIRWNDKKIESRKSKQSSNFHSKKPHIKEGKIYSGVRRVVVIV